MKWEMVHRYISTYWKLNEFTMFNDAALFSVTQRWLFFFKRLHLIHKVFSICTGTLDFKPIVILKDLEHGLKYNSVPKIRPNVSCFNGKENKQTKKDNK